MGAAKSSQQIGQRRATAVAALAARVTIWIDDPVSPLALASRSLLLLSCRAAKMITHDTPGWLSFRGASEVILQVAG
jgi:hypothetical protein